MAVLLALTALIATTLAPASSADVGSNYFDPGSIEPWYSVLGSGYGCVVPRPNGKLEARVTTERSEKIARRLIARKTKIRGVKLGYVRRVDGSQSIVNFLSAWQYANMSLTRQSFSPFVGASKWVSSPLVPISKTKCRSVVVSVYSYPGHDATVDEIAWANSVAATYPKNVVTDVRTVDSAPVIPQ